MKIQENLASKKNYTPAKINDWNWNPQNLIKLVDVSPFPRAINFFFVCARDSQATKTKATTKRKFPLVRFRQLKGPPFEQ